MFWRLPARSTARARALNVAAINKTSLIVPVRAVWSSAAAAASADSLSPSIIDPLHMTGPLDDDDVYDFSRRVYEAWPHLQRACGVIE